MDLSKLVIRPVDSRDVKSIAKLYKTYVQTSTVTLDLRAPTRYQMRRKIHALKNQNYPFYIVAYERNLCGFCYLSPFRPKAGYRYVVEDTIYLDPEYKGLGLASALLETVLSVAQARGFRQVMAMISVGEAAHSEKLHQKLGFEQVGYLAKIGFKFGKWQDVAIYQKDLDQVSSKYSQEFSGKISIK